MDKMFLLWIFSVSMVLNVVLVVIEAAPESGLITHLPGFNATSFPSKHYSGYVSIENVGVLPPKNLFYYFVESERNPSKDPVVLWLNGGPGCSSMDGFIYEHGIKAGEKPVINFKGYMIGNGVTDPKFDGNALVPFAHGMALISDDLFEEVKAACGGNYYSEPNQNCLQKLGKVDNAIGYLNIYDILEPCYHSPPSSMKNNIPNSTFGELGKTERPLPVRKRMFGRAWPFKAPVLPGIVPSWPQLLSSGSVPCIDDEVATAWLNDESVRKALHAASKNETGEWQLCTTLGYSHDAGSMLTYHKNLTMQGYRALIYSGDHDMCVPFTGTQAWTRSLGYNIVEEWRPWYPTDQDVASGYLQGYDHNLTFFTIKGAGHTVPEYKPRESLHFYSRWLVGENI
ncbi:hypothetical protein EZV62_024688 [Acer yangbiense]|uniref:Uncharacterized protein n=1 Tax=Acer yangbiense TaxID=1000413 RepID=A0A5C7GVS3_9ROSI|nr:hypothetical protein EZV62_024688 [Acer yangbiense]